MTKKCLYMYGLIFISRTEQSQLSTGLIGHELLHIRSTPLRFPLYLPPNCHCCCKCLGHRLSLGCSDKDSREAYRSH